MAEKIVPARRERCNAARFLILWPTHTVPPVDVKVFALEDHLVSLNQFIAFKLEIGGSSRRFC